MRARAGIDALGVQLRVDRVRSDLAGVSVAPDLAEAVVVLAAAERARAMSGGEGGRLVEEEELGEAARLEQRRRRQPRNSSRQPIQRLPL